MSTHRDGDIDDVWREHRAYMIDLAFRMLGNIQDAEDVVQEAFTRLLREDLTAIEDIRGWLIVVVSRLCLDQLGSSRSRRVSTVGSLEDHAQDARPGTFGPSAASIDPADRVTLDDSIRLALLVVLEKLSPAERAVFVLHDIFGLPFEATADIVGRTPAACRQLASRARRRIEAETGPGRFSPAVAEQHQVAEQFIAACAGGDLETLIRLLDPEVVGHVDLGAGGLPQRLIVGDRLVAQGSLNFLGPRTATTLVSQPVNGRPGLLAFRDRALYGIFVFRIGDDGRIQDIHGILDPAKLAPLNASLMGSSNS
jgi:RNA polymerase sigma-70 factor, ECF subfamily